jgi:hypothetical protein
MNKLVKITIRSDERSNRKIVKKGMFIEFMTRDSSGKVYFGDDLNKIADMFANKYGTKCERGSIVFSDILIE